jgi:hypothetical protein
MLMVVSSLKLPPVMAGGRRRARKEPEARLAEPLPFVSTLLLVFDGVRGMKTAPGSRGYGSLEGPQHKAVTLASIPMSETSSKRHIQKLPMRLFGVSLLLLAFGLVLAGSASVRPGPGTPAASAAVTVSWGNPVAVSWGSYRGRHDAEA